MGRFVPLLAAGAVVISAGLLHGLWTNRWQTNRELDEAVARLRDVPRAVGDWHGEEQDLGPDGIRGTGAAGFCCRRYENRRSRQTVTVLLLCGRPGPVSVHTPDVCYEGAGYKMVGVPTAVGVPVGGEVPEAPFKTARFKGSVALPSELRVFWSWQAGGAWQAPEDPRLAFARQPALYKLYVIRRQAATAKGRPEEDPAVAFLKVFLPALDEALRPRVAGP
jgi:hypothetical protein